MLFERLWSVTCASNEGVVPTSVSWPRHRVEWVGLGWVSLRHPWVFLGLMFLRLGWFSAMAFMSTTSLSLRNWL